MPAHPDNAYRLLRDQQQLALVFPEGTKATVQDVHRPLPAPPVRPRAASSRSPCGAGVPVVPIAVVGAEESMPIALPAARPWPRPSSCRTSRSPSTSSCSGPSAIVTYFPAKIKLRVLDPITFDVAPDQERYSRSRVMDEAETIRARLQETLYDMLRERRSVWFG